MEPIFRGFTRVRVSTIRIVNDFCVVKAYLFGGLTLPVGNLDWQRVEGFLGLEWCPNKDLTIDFIGPFYFLNYWACPGPYWNPRCGWYQKWGTLFTLGFRYYLPSFHK